MGENMRQRDVTKVDAWVTTDNTFHTVRAEAVRHQAAVDFEEWYEGRVIYVGREKVGARDIREWIVAHQDQIREFLERI